ncbi:MAG: hypothetical protein PHO70_01060 [Candidatus Omnitrophica bacterium]|nr:hypothetical protein [Candidatus Omnitrophota bacterium]
MLIYLNKKAQSTAEYVIVLGLVVGAVVAMQTFVKRGLQGRIHDAVKYTGAAGDTDAKAIFKGNQYDPNYVESNLTRSSSSEESEKIATGGGEITKELTKESSSTTGTQTMEAEDGNND